MSTTQHQVHEGPCHGLKLVVINFLHDDLLDTQRAFVPLFSSHNNQQPRRTRRAQQIHPMHNLSAYLFFLSSAMQILPLLYSWDFATLWFMHVTEPPHACFCFVASISWSLYLKFPFHLSLHISCSCNNHNNIGPQVRVISEHLYQVESA
jgi:hypothetical protein